MTCMQEMFRLESPGGGGYGYKDDREMDGAMRTPPAKKARVFSATGSVADYTSAQESA